MESEIVLKFPGQEIGGAAFLIIARLFFGFAARLAQNTPDY
jgi:hypothetical protein